MKKTKSETEWESRDKNGRARSELGHHSLKCILRLADKPAPFLLTFVNNRKLNDLFRDIEPDSIDYKNLKLDKKITKGRSSNIYLTKDNQILKMFTSNSTRQELLLKFDVIVG